MTPSLPKQNEPFRAGATALLLVDMQRVWLEPGADPAHPERGPDHYFYRQTASQTIPNQERLLAAARANGVEGDPHHHPEPDRGRPPGSSGSIPVQSEDIPGDVGLDPEERSRRAEIMFAPFHDRVAAHLDDRAKQGRATRIATIHSFTPVFLGVGRPWHAGVLYDQAIEFGQAVLAGLNIGGALNAAANEPYVIRRDGDYAIPVHGDDRRIPAVLIEIRQDLLASPTGIEEWAKRLAAALPAQQTKAL
ncbi:N-formylglutamate amidohydrolase [Mesorhizobium sp. M0909]|uniref:N-formylglutamate amidohydrolase n=1 Tax=Mesorhizobium sp. M0909 TaxID=2957024 RepID=UPI003336F55D